MKIIGNAGIPICGMSSITELILNFHAQTYFVLAA